MVMGVQLLAVEHDDLPTDPCSSHHHLLLLKNLHSNQVENHSPSPTQHLTQKGVRDSHVAITSQ